MVDMRNMYTITSVKRMSVKQRKLYDYIMDG